MAFAARFPVGRFPHWEVGVPRSSGRRVLPVSVCAGVLALLSVVGASSASSTPSTTKSSAKSQVTVLAPKTSPVKIGDVKKGKPLSKGDALISREVSITRGKDTGKSTNVVTMTCPGNRTVSATADSKDLGKPFPYTFNKERTYGKATAKLTPTAYDLKAGKTRKGTLYVLCIGNA